MHKRMEPELVQVLREGYSRRQFPNDLMAGVITGIVALPLAIAFAIASGVAPEQGLYTAIIAGFIISLLSGSRVQIGGPTGAFIVVVYSVVSRFGIEGLTLATLLAGVLLMIMGFARLGSVIKYIPYPVTIGFTAGIAVIIAVTQLRDLAGLQIEKVPAEFIGKLTAYARHIGTVNPWALATSALALAILLLWPKVTRRIPGSIIALLICTLVVHLFKLPVETIGSRFGEMPRGLPAPRMPLFSWSLVKELFPSALTIALLGAIESLLSAVVADGMTGRRHRSNMELVAQGAANLVAPFFGGIPATGAIARTATNIKNGGRTPFAGMIHAITLLLILLFFGRWCALIPMAALAAILLVVAYNMSEWRLFVRLFNCPRSDCAVLLTTFLLTVFLDLTVAIQTGVVLAAFLFIRRMEQTSIIKPFSDDEAEEESADALFIPEGVEVFEINGPFFFGAAHKFKDTLSTVEKKPRVLILRMRHVPAMDATGLHALEALARQARSDGTALLLSGIQRQPARVLVRSGLADRIGHDRIHKKIEQALDHARTLTSPESDNAGAQPIDKQRKQPI